MESQSTLLKGRYSVIELLGKGGMGEVFLAEDTLLSRRVAVKKVNYEGNEYLLKFAENEARVLARLQHQCLPKVLDYFNEDSSQYIVMEYITGKDLGEMLRHNNAPFSTEQVWAWEDTLLGTLEYLHSQSYPIVHRDIKPQNIKITDDGKLFLLDFGLVKDTPTRVRSDSLPPSVFGYSQSYAPPEQISGDHTSVQTDVYGLCATLYQLYTNVKPADATSRALKKIENKPDPLRPAHEVNPRVPHGLSKVLEAGLQLNCDERVKSVQALRQLFNQARNKHERIHITIDSSDNRKEESSELFSALKESSFLGSRRKKYTIIAAAGAVTVIVLSLIGYWLIKGFSAQKQFDDAKAIESTEGLLSQRACLQFKNVETYFLNSRVANELVRKLEDCTSVQNMFNDAQSSEKIKGLTYAVASNYKEIVEKFPGSTYAKQASLKVSEFEATKKATIQAWNDLQEADNIASKKREEGSTTSQYFHESAYLYGRINLENVDPILVDHIKNSIETFNEGDSVFSEIEQEVAKIEANSQRIIEYGRQVGASQIPEQGAEKGELAGREVANDWAQKELAKLKEKKADMLSQFAEKMRKTAQMDKTISSKLKEKYNVEFLDRY